ncbi:solute carrier family 35 member G2-like [Branchiostoma lanceolatum]|uniref:solute carrier family 35 member G2-like n=1 Tax=Branchiostoma lanceolatum TaxID=7740 RepID=UPI003455C7EE
MQVDALPSGDGSDEDTLRKLFATQPDATKQQTSEVKISWKAVKDVSIAASYGIIFAFVTVLTRQVTDNGVTAFQVVFIQEASALLVALGLVLWSKTDLRPASLWVLGQLVLQGVGKYLVFVCLVVAITYLPPANATAINNSALPLFIAIGAYVFLQQRPSLAACFGGVLCTAGIVLVAAGSWENIGTSRDNSAPIIGVSLAILSALIETFMNVQLRLLLVRCSDLAVLFYVHIVSSTVGLLITFLTHPKWGMDVYITLLLVLCGGLYAVSAFIYVKAAKAVPAVTQILLYQLEVAGTFVLQFALLGIVPTLVEGVGAAVITVGSLIDSAGIVIADSRKRKRLNVRKQLGFDIGGDIDKDSRDINKDEKERDRKTERVGDSYHRRKFQEP